MSKYVIRVTRIRDDVDVLDKKEEEHYYKGKYNNRPAYRLAYSSGLATYITEQEPRKIVKEIELIYKEK